MSFDKDAWIRLALEKGAYDVDVLGNVTRRVPNGAFFLREPVPTRIHKKSGRVILDMRFLGVTKTVLLNRLVALKHLPNPSNLPEVNHKDGNKENNAVSNLEWAGRKEQELHAQRTGLKSNRGSQNSNAKLTASQVIGIRSSTASDDYLAKQLGVSRKTIRDIRLGKSWTHL